VVTCGRLANYGWWPMLWFVIKSVIIILVFRLACGDTLPRMPYETVHALG